jgi:hypothetical protein
MTSITTRAAKGSPLTHNEVDANFTNLNTDKLESSTAAATYAPKAGPVFTGVTTVAAGSAAAPALTFTGATSDTGLYSPGADQVAIGTGGTGRLFVDASGRVGVGTGSPTSLGTNVTTVEIQGAATTRSGGLRLSSSDSSQKGAFYIYDGLAVLGTETSHPLGLYVGNTERARITSAGLVGIGTSDPIFLTDILSGTANTGANVNNPSQLSVTGPNKSLTGGGATVFINSNSNIAIDTGGSIAFSGRNTTSSTTSVVWGTIKGAKENATSTNTAGYLAFATTNHSAGSLVEAARIDSSGRLLVGATSDSGGALLQVNGDRVRIATAKTPASASAAGTAGEVCWDASYIYVCTATNTWKRTALSSW